MRDTKFPNIYTEWDKLKDIKPSDYEYINEYKECINENDFFGAQDALDKLKNKVMQTADWQERYDVVSEMYDYLYSIRDNAGQSHYYFVEKMPTSGTDFSFDRGNLFFDWSINNVGGTAIIFSKSNPQLYSRRPEDIVITASIKSSVEGLVTTDTIYKVENSNPYNVVKLSSDCTKITLNAVNTYRQKAVTGTITLGLKDKNGNIKYDESGNPILSTLTYTINPHETLNWHINFENVFNNNIYPCPRIYYYVDGTLTNIFDYSVVHSKETTSPGTTYFAYFESKAIENTAYGEGIYKYMPEFYVNGTKYYPTYSDNGSIRTYKLGLYVGSSINDISIFATADSSDWKYGLKITYYIITTYKL